MTQNKARRTNKIDFLQLPVTQEVASSSLVGPAIIFSELKNWHRILRGGSARPGSATIDYSVFRYSII